MNSVIQNAKRLIIKVGSSLVTNDGHGLDHDAIAKWSEQIARLRHQGKEIILVSSGAIAEGMLQLGFSKRPVDIHELQACAAVGQMGLVQIYQTSFETHGLHAAQVLLTHADLADRERYLNARSTLFTLLRFGVIRWGLPLSCPPGFTVGDCERMDFLDTYIWTESKNYRVGNSECSHGVAFRTWAPAATSVQVIIQNDTSSASYAMR